MLLLLLACLSERSTAEGEPREEADADTDADSDSDTDSDADADADTDTDTDADTDPQEPFVAFEVASGDEGREMDWSAESGQSIDCWQFDDGWLWLHFEDPEAGLALDLDVCNYEGSGEYMAFDPRVQDCPGAPAFDVWWTEQAEVIWVSAVGEPCSLSLDAESGLGGEFDCVLGPLDADQPDDGRGDRVLRLGSFWCEVIPWE